MKTQQMSKYWQLNAGRYLTELLPSDSTREHYAGDECWCHPHVLHIHDSSEAKRGVFIWVHTETTPAEKEDFAVAVQAILNNWKQMQP